MPFDWKEFLVLARALSKNPDEASLRSAVSRAYYCAFNIAMARAEENGYRPKGDATGGMHDLLWQLYGRNQDVICQEISLLGPRMKWRRVKADYKPIFSNRPSEEAQYAIDDADKCLNLLSRLVANLPDDVPRSWHA
jgi:uncharacterized protein (UPF0332 family)